MAERDVQEGRRRLEKALGLKNSDQSHLAQEARESYLRSIGKLPSTFYPTIYRPSVFQPINLEEEGIAETSRDLMSQVKVEVASNGSKIFRTPRDLFIKNAQSLASD